MDKGKKPIRDAHLTSIMKTWLLVIPIIVGIIGSGTAIALWLAVRGEPVADQVNYHINSVDRAVLDNIRGNFRHIYLQYLQARINPDTRAEQVEQLEKRLNNLAQEEEKIILKYDPDYASSWPSALKTLSEILAQLPGPIAYTLCLVAGLLFFIITRSIAFFFLKRRYSLDPGSDYTQEV